MPYYRTRGHFCNYWRKVLESKCVNYKSALANPLIWFAWKESHFRNDITRKLKNLSFDGDIKSFNAQLQRVHDDYHHLPGFGSK